MSSCARRSRITAARRSGPRGTRSSWPSQPRPAPWRPPSSVQRSLAAEPWPEGAEIRVRIGLHTGEASFGGEDYVGLHVHRASRIASVAHGGQVLARPTTRALVGTVAPGRCRAPRRRRASAEGSRASGAALAARRSRTCAATSPRSARSSDAEQPAERLTTFLGREARDRARSAPARESPAADAHRPGGTGKTRLSLEVAGGLLARYPDGVYFVELAPITDPELVASDDRPGTQPARSGRQRSSIERLIDYLASDACCSSSTTSSR